LLAGFELKIHQLHSPTVNENTKVFPALASGQIAMTHTVQEQTKQRRNGYDLIRLIAASAVIFGHAYPLTGRVTPHYLANHVGAIAVKIFFVTSGFLVARSWLAEPKVSAFIVKRALRILPGLIALVFFTIAIIGPLATSLPLERYFANANTRGYLKNILLFPIYDLPGVFAGNRYPTAVNGSLWSLPAEVAMYVITPVVLGFKAKNAGLLSLIAGTAIVFLAIYLGHVASPATPIVIWGTSVASVLDPAPYYMIGMVFAVFHLERFGRPLASLILLCAAAKTIKNPLAGEVLLLLLLPFTVISIGELKFSRLDFLFKKGDFSYGIYLYGFAIQQTVVHFTNNRLGPWANFAISWPITMVLAFISWKWVERRALKLRAPLQSLIDRLFVRLTRGSYQ